MCDTKEAKTEFQTRTEPNKPKDQKRFKLLSCEIIYREVCLLAAQSRHIIDVKFLRKGLHDAGQEKMRQTIQDHISSCDKETYNAILLGYGRCNNGIIGIKADSIPIVVPRAHDCITFFFGSRDEYEKYFSQHPGTYYRTTGWTERSDYDSDSVMHQLGLDRTYDEYVAKYGKDNAQYIMQSMGNWENQYNYLAYIDMGLPMDTEYARLAQNEASQKKLQFKHLPGDLRLLRAMLSGKWNEHDFLVIQPGQELISEDSGQILSVVNTIK